MVWDKNRLGTNYDANGNALGTGLQYDYDNRLEVSGSMAYGYGADNKRVYRRKVSGTVRNPIYTDYIYFYSGNQRLGTYRMERNAQNQPVLANVSRELYFGGADWLLRTGSGQRPLPGCCPMERSLLLRWTNAIGSPPTIAMRMGSTMPIKRYYSAGSGRFLTADPYLASGGVAKPSSWNRYAYVTGDPVNKTDRSGLNEEYPDYCDIYPEDPRCYPFYNPFGLGGGGGGEGGGAESYPTIPNRIDCLRDVALTSQQIAMLGSVSFDSLPGATQMAF